MTTINIKLRNKFVKVIENAEDLQAYTNACEKFCGLTEDAASGILWRLAYNANTSSEDLRRLGLNPEEIPEGNLALLRNELRSQYKQHHPKSWEVDVPELCMEAFTDLKNHTDEIVATQVLDRCFGRVSSSQEDMERLLFLLKSDMENRYFGGLRELSFSSEQAAYLKPFHLEIHNLFVAVYNCFKQQTCSGDSFTNKPFEGLAERINQAGVNLSDDELPFDMESHDSCDCKNAIPDEAQPEPPAESPVGISVEASAQTGPAKFTALTLENILAHREIFFSFAVDKDFRSLEQIRALGFDLNVVISRVEIISQILWYAPILEEAKLKLDMATKALSN